jgi:hypothetical protein
LIIKKNPKYNPQIYTVVIVITLEKNNIQILNSRLEKFFLNEQKLTPHHIAPGMVKKRLELPRTRSST